MDDRGADPFAALETKGWDALLGMLDADPELVNARDSDRNTLLHLSIRQRQVEQVRRLLLVGADANAVAGNGMSPLVLAMDSVCPSEVVPILVEHGADPDAVDAAGFSVLERAAIGIDYEWIPALLAAGARIAPDDEGRNYPLLQAAFVGLWVNVQSLLDAGAPASQGPNLFLQPLHPAAALGHLKVVELLLEHGADPNKHGMWEWCRRRRDSGPWKQHCSHEEGAERTAMTPLSLAASCGHLAVCERLLKGGADPNRSDYPVNTPLLSAATAGNAGLMELLLNNGALANLGRKDGTTPLLLAVEGDHMAAVSVLLARGAVANAADETGWTPLHRAALDSTPGLVEMLLAKDASVFAEDDTGRTPLRVAAEGGNVEGLKALLDAGSPVNLADRDGNTPLHAAAKSLFPEAVPILLDAGADPTVRNEAGETPQAFAVRAGHLDAADLLRAREAGEGSMPRLL